MPSQTFTSGKYSWTIKTKGGSIAAGNLGAHMQQKLARVSAAIRGESLADTAVVGAQVIESEARNLVKVGRTGILRKAITHEIAESSDTHAAVNVGAGKEAPYAAFVEFGTGIYAEGGKGRKDPWVYPIEINGEIQFRRTRGMPARPFLRPPMTTHRKQAVQAMRDAFKRQIDRAVQ